MKSAWWKRTASVLTCLLACAPASAQEIDIHGFASQGFLWTSDNNYLADTKDNGSSQFNEFGVNFSGDLTDKLRVGMQLFSRDLGPLDNNRLILDWAYLDYRMHEAFGIRAGRMKVAYGLYNEVLDVDSVRGTVLLPQSVYDIRYRDFLLAYNGAAAYGYIEAGPMGSFEYQAGGGSMTIPEDGSLADVFGQRLGRSESNYFLNGALRWNTPLEGLRLSGTWSLYSHVFGFDLSPQAQAALAQAGLPADQIPSEVTLDYKSIPFWVFSAEYTIGDMVIASEYHRRKGEGTSSHEMIIPTATTFVEGFYTQVAYRWNDWFETTAYYSVLYNDADDKEGKNQPDGMEHRVWQKDAALALRFDLNDYWLFKLEGHLVNGTAQVNSSLNTNAAGELDVEKDWFSVAAKTTVTF